MDLSVWWLDQKDCEAIEGHLTEISFGDSANEDTFPKGEMLFQMEDPDKLKWRYPDGTVVDWPPDVTKIEGDCRAHIGCTKDKCVYR